MYMNTPNPLILYACPVCLEGTCLQLVSLQVLLLWIIICGCDGTAIALVLLPVLSVTPCHCSAHLYGNNKFTWTRCDKRLA